MNFNNNLKYCIHLIYCFKTINIDHLMCLKLSGIVQIKLSAIGFNNYFED